MSHENEISRTNNLLLILGEPDDLNGELDALARSFCGEVARSLHGHDLRAIKQIYVCGDLRLLVDPPYGVRVIRELSTHIELKPQSAVEVGLGQTPVLVNGVGVFYRRLFDEDDLFVKIAREHAFQQLTESTKASKALRTGIYLTQVEQELTSEARERLHFRLLRCSSNLSGPTDNLRQTDLLIMDAINQAARETFAQETSLNHVLAQIYENHKDEDGPRERKAKISAHSDKTKDMREDGLIAFCTFYDPAGFTQLRPSALDPFDWCYQKTSGLTRLHFKRKPTVDDPALVEEFCVTLYPNSVFIIPLSTNRLYTHEIRPSLLNIDRIPTRMGYVARSSKAEAVFMDGQTYLKQDDGLIKLEPMTAQTLAELRASYHQENRSDEVMRYGEVHFSMNAGDYQKPLY